MKTLTIPLLVVLFGAASAVHAQDRPADAAPAPTPAPAVPAVVLATGEPVAMAPEELGALNGRQGSTSTILSDQDLTAVNRGNTVNANTVGSGQIVLGSGAFDGFAGVGNFVINSGHNNNLQGALTINIIGSQ